MEPLPYFAAGLATGLAFHFAWGGFRDRLIAWRMGRIERRIAELAKSDRTRKVADVIQDWSPQGRDS